jgi:hypothetical protein
MRATDTENSVIRQPLNGTASRVINPAQLRPRVRAVRVLVIPDVYRMT